MAVTVSTTNKPLIPRAKDYSPSPIGYNRGALYSGKALDFDGVNDYVNLDGFTMSGNTATFCFYADVDNDAYVFDINPNRFILLHNTAEGIRVYNNTTWSNYGLIEREATLFYTIVCDGTSQSVYVNGQKFGDTKTVTALNLSAATQFKLGSNYLGSGTFYNGTLSNYRIFNTALTAAQVADLYLNPEKIVPDGVADSALKLWLPMMEGAGTTVYDGAADLTDYVTNGDFSDGTNNWTASNATLSVEDGALKITSTGGNRPQANQTISGLTIGRKYLLSALSRVGTTAFNMEIEISGIAALSTYNKTSDSTFTYIYYEFTATSTSHQIQAKIDDASVPAGQTGFFDDIKLLDLGNYGTISGATWVQGVGAPVAQTSVIDWNKWYLDHTNEVLIPQGLTSGRDLLGNLFESARNPYSLNLDGASWGEVHDNASLDITDEVTLECWLYHTDTADLEHIIGKRALSGSWLRIYSASANTLRVERDGGGATSNVSITENAWSHIVATIDTSDTVRVYVNGTQQTSKLNFTPWGMDNVAPVSIGAWVTESGTPSSNSYESGSIALPRIYNRALTATEVTRNYNADKSKFGL